MTIDINELRLLVQRYVGVTGIAPIMPGTAIELLGRLERAEKTNSDWLRANAPGGWIDALRLECDYLLARIEEMERREPSSPTTATGYGNRFPLYLAPGAQPTQSIPEGWGKDLLTIQHAMAMNNWNWNSDASDDLKREAYTAVTRLLAAAPGRSSSMDAIIDDLQSQFDAEGITENDSGEALIRLSGAIAAVEDNFARAVPNMPELLESLRCACNYIDKLGGVSQQYRAMLSSPEDKP